MRPRAWAVGDRCWVAYDSGERHQAKAGTVGDRTRSGRVLVGTWIGRGIVGNLYAIADVFADKAGAVLRAAEKDVESALQNIKHDEMRIEDLSKSLAEERVFLAKAEKRLAKLRATK